jgi:hypothetical protein
VTHNVTAQYRDYLLQTTGRAHELATYNVDQTEFFILMEGADVWANWTETAGNGAIASETTSVYAGNIAAKLTAGAGVNTKVAQAITTVAAKEYRLRFWTRGDGTYGGQYGIYDASNSGDITAKTATAITGTAYTQVTKEFTAPASCISVRIDLWCPSTNTGVAYFDAIEVIDIAAGTGTNLLSNGGFETSGARILMETGDKILYEEQTADAATYVLNAQFRDYLLTAEQVDRD